MKILERLEKLLADATPGKWKYDWGNWNIEGPDRQSIAILSGLYDIEGNPIASNPWDGELAAELKNAAPALLAVARAAKNMGPFAGDTELRKALQALAEGE
jgi:hypothetical protein